MRLASRRLAAIALVCAGALACAHPQRAVQPDPARPLTAAALQAQGLAALRAGDGVRAEQYLALAMRAGAPASSVIAPLVEACAASSRLQSALGHALPYLHAHPAAWRLRQLVAAIQLALGRSELARAELARVIRDQPHAAQAHYLFALVARDEQDLDAAAGAFAAYLRERPVGLHAAEARAFLREHEATATPPTAEPNPSGGPP
jgi:tetratricopeptide (TPR) repeat protein